MERIFLENKKMLQDYPEYGYPAPDCPERIPQRHVHAPHLGNTPDVVLSGIHNPHKSLFHRNHIPQGIPTYEGHFHPSVVLAGLLYSVRLLSAEPRSGDLRPAKQKTSRLSWSLLHSLQGICLFAFEEIIRHFLLADTLSLSFVLRENGGPAYP